MWYERNFPEFIQIGYIENHNGEEERWSVYAIKTTKSSCERVLVGIVYAFASIAEEYALRELQQEEG